MRIFSILLGLALIAFCVSADAAVVLDEDFNYGTGMLGTVSGGNWTTWLNSSQDAVVVSKMMVLDGQGVPEPCTFFSNALPGVSIMTASYDFFVHEEGNAEADSYFWFTGGDPATADVNYIGWAFIQDWAIADVGATSLHLWMLDEASGLGIVELATGLTVDAWHNVQLIAKQTISDPLSNAPTDPDGQFQVYLDGNLVLDWTNFSNNSPWGVNCVDVYMFDDGEEHDFHAFDKIYIETIPEPGMLVLAGLGLLALIRRRK